MNIDNRIYSLHHILCLQESIQEDLLCALDGTDYEDEMCEQVVSTIFRWWLDQHAGTSPTDKVQFSYLFKTKADKISTINAILSATWITMEQLARCTHFNVLIKPHYSITSTSYYRISLNAYANNRSPVTPIPIDSLIGFEILKEDGTALEWCKGIKLLPGIKPNALLEDSRGNKLTRYVVAERCMQAHASQILIDSVDCFKGKPCSDELIGMLEGGFMGFHKMSDKALTSEYREKEKIWFDHFDKNHLPWDIYDEDPILKGKNNVH
jgi:hypothetical protein